MSSNHIVFWWYFQEKPYYQWLLTLNLAQMKRLYKKVSRSFANVKNNSDRKLFRLYLEDLAYCIYEDEPQ